MKAMRVASARALGICSFGTALDVMTRYVGHGSHLADGAVMELERETSLVFHHPRGASLSWIDVVYRSGSVVTYWSDGDTAIATPGSDTRAVRSRVNRYGPPGWQLHRLGGETWLRYACGRTERFRGSAMRKALGQ